MKKNIFVRIFSFFIILIFLISAASFSTYKFYADLFSSEISDHSTKALSIMSGTIDQHLYELFQSSNLLSSEDSIRELLYTDTKTSIGYDHVYNAISVLGKFKRINHLIDSIFIYHRQSNLIISDEGSHHFGNFMNEYYQYKLYNKDYWSNMEFDKVGYQILKTSEVLDGKTKKRVIPVVQPGVDHVKTSNLFVINVDTDKIALELERQKSTPNSILLIMDRSGNIYAVSDKSQIEAIHDEEFLIQLQSNNSKFRTHIFNKDMQVYTHSSKYFLFKDFVYVALVPTKDISEKSSYAKKAAYLITSIGIIITIFLAYLMSRNIYNPIQSVIQLLKRNQTPSSAADSENEFEYLNQKIKSILENNQNLEDNLLVALPMASENYLQRILNNNEQLSSREYYSFLEKNHISFQHNHFMAAIIQINFSDEFYNKFNKEEQLLIISGTAKVIKNVFPSEYQNYVLLMEKNNIGIILNLSNDVTEDDVVKHISRLYTIYQKDNNFIEIHTGLGKIHEGINNLHVSYSEANRALSFITPFSEDKIVIFQDNRIESNYSYSIEEENKIFNYFMVGNKDEGLKIVHHVIEKNVVNNLTQQDLKDLYIQIYNTALRVLNKKNVSVSELLGDEYINISSNYRHISIKEVERYLFVLIDQINEMNKSHFKGKADVSSIINYINHNFHKDLYMDELASQNSITPQYLSKILKEELGVPFMKYISTLRINKAKKLLLETDHNIGYIAKHCGFNNRTSFLRMFKKIEGITPTEYRNSQN